MSLSVAPTFEVASTGCPAVTTKSINPHSEAQFHIASNSDPVTTIYHFLADHSDGSGPRYHSTAFLLPARTIVIVSRPFQWESRWLRRKVLGRKLSATSLAVDRGNPWEQIGRVYKCACASSCCPQAVVLKLLSSSCCLQAVVLRALLVSSLIDIYSENPRLYLLL